MLRLACCLFLILPSAFAGRLTSLGEVSAFVVLSSEPLAAAPVSGVRPAAMFLPIADRRQMLAEEQQAAERQIVALGGTVTDRFDTLLNALVVRVAANRLVDLRALPGVKSVSLEKHYRPSLETSVPWIGAPKGWSLTSGPWTGTGMRIAIIDSGIDYTHASLGGKGTAAAFSANDPTVIESGSFPTARVVGGTDFVGDDYDSNGEVGSPTPRPDADPLDTYSNGHGTHVAAIAAGNGVLTNGLAYKGVFDSTLDFSQFSIGPGVAPQAKLYAYKVFGGGGSTASSIIVKALERSLDPNQDGNYADHVDVVNLSLGSPFGVMNSQDPEAEAINRLCVQGVVVVVASGNNGNTFYTASSPGIAYRAITVANSLDNGAAFSTIKVTAPSSVSGDYASVEAVFTPPLSSHGPVTAPVVWADPATACDPLKNTAALKGVIALIDRGTCYFVDKIRAVQTAGALGVIMVNNVDGPPIEMGGRGDTSDIKIPAVMISQLDGLVLKGQLAKGLTVTLDAFAAVGRPELADQVSDSSSRGPSIGDNRLKPDLSAPGTGINSAKAGTGFESTSMTGTSMSTPHVAGAAALMRQAHPSWTVEQIKAGLMNTASIMLSGMKNKYPESRVGAGRLQVDAAIRNQVLILADNAQGDVSLSFGVQELLETTSLERTVKVVNQGALPVTFEISVTNTILNAGVTLIPSTNRLTVEAKATAQMMVRLEIDPVRLEVQRDLTSGAAIGDKIRYFLNEVSGQLWFTSETQELHLPWHVVARANSSTSVAASRLGVSADPVSWVPMPTRGPSAHPSPLAAVFQLGQQISSGGSSPGDLLAVGAASDYAVTQDLSQARVFFGLVTAGKWTTPQYELVGLEVEIDVDQDGTADYLLLNASSGNLNGQGIDPDLANDALLTLVADMALDSDYFIASAPLNVLTPDYRDTAPFHNRVAVHSAPVSVLGLTPGKTKIKYRVTATDALTDAQTESKWIDFDVAAPVVDPTGRGLKNTPYFDEGGSVGAFLNRAAAAAAGFTTANPPKALVIHPQGRRGQQFNVVTMDLGSSDLDGDGLPDVWELEQLGDLSSDGGSDPDGDGQSNAIEFAAKTNPQELHLTTSPALDGTFHWLGSSSRNYTLERSATLDGAFVPVVRHLPGVNGTNSVSDPAAGLGNQTWFYRVRSE